MPTLEEVRAEIGDCHRCALCEGRNTIVFGVGNPSARIMFIGEAPGRNEDLQGEPFVGAAGKFLNELLGYAGLSREDIYIANILKCRPPGNRDPQPDEIVVCTPYLRDQIRAIHPDYLVTLGKFATQFVLKTDRGISGLHGNVYRTGRFIVVPMYHPAAALYDRSKAEDLQTDFAMLGALVHGQISVDDAQRPEPIGAPRSFSHGAPSGVGSPNVIPESEASSQGAQAPLSGPIGDPVSQTSRREDAGDDAQESMF